VELTFRPLTDDDLPLLHRWLNDPGVVRWWEGDDVSWDGVVRDYGGGGDGPEEHYIAVAGGRPVGWIQCGGVSNWPEEYESWRSLGVDDAAAGIDYLVGDPDARGGGLGSAMIRTFVDEVVFGRHPEWTQAGADPHVDNVASWRALEKAGFRFLGEVPSEHGPGRLMVIDRADLEPA